MPSKAHFKYYYYMKTSQKSGLNPAWINLITFIFVSQYAHNRCLISAYLIKHIQEELA